jgi:hypothetical protein
MSTVETKHQKEIREQILNLLRKRDYRPIELIQTLQGREVTESELKDVLAALIEGSVIELSADRHITLRANHSATLAAAR